MTNLASTVHLLRGAIRKLPKYTFMNVYLCTNTRNISYKLTVYLCNSHITRYIKSQTIWISRSRWSLLHVDKI